MISTTYCPVTKTRTNGPCSCSTTQKVNALVGMMQRKMPKDENGRPILRIVKEKRG